MKQMSSLPPKPPSIRLIAEGGGHIFCAPKFCRVCGSTVKRKLFGAVIGCINPYCENYYNRERRELENAMEELSKEFPPL